MTQVQSEQEMIKQMISNPYSYAAIYTRISGKNQSESIEAQIARGEEMALQNNLLIYKVYKEEISATKNKIKDREALYNMLEDAKAGYFKHLIVFRRDRLARIFDDYLEIKNKLLKYGVTILFTNDFQVPIDNSPLSSFLDNIIMAVAELEPKYIRERVEAGLKVKIEKGEYFRNKPRGYKIVKEDGIKKYKIDENHERYIKAIFKTFLEEDIKTIDQLFNRLAIKGLIPSNLRKHEVVDILTHSIYAGLELKDKEKHRFDGFKLIEISTGDVVDISLNHFREYTNVDKIVEIKDWHKIAEKLSAIEENSNKRSFNPYKKVLLNVVFCKKCNKPMTANRKYYKCGKCGTLFKFEEVIKWVEKELLDAKVTSNICNEIKNEIESRINKEVKEREEELAKKAMCIREFVERLTEDPTDEYLRKSIESLVDEENIIKKDLYYKKYKVRLIKNSKSDSISDLIIKKIKERKDNWNSLKEVIDCFVEKVVLNNGSSKKCTVEYKEF
ncbi:recombinase family protein [Clostridium sp.]|uniref:recombinase family protein n=1 Tax=Clostridium sp. TaxID=1506 RepID=UPI002FC612DD